MGAQILFHEWWRNTFHGWLIDPGSLAGLSTMVFAGMAIATLFRPASLIQTPRSRIAWILVFAAGFAAAAFLVRPILGLGIVKGPATPAYCLYTTSIACTIYALLYWLVDLRKVSRWNVAGGAGRLEYAVDVLAPLDCRLLTCHVRNRLFE